MATLDAQAADPLSSPRPAAALPALCITQITSWGILYYAFPVLAPSVAADTGWSTTTITAAFPSASSSPPSQASPSAGSSTIEAPAPS